MTTARSIASGAPSLEEISTRKTIETLTSSEDLDGDLAKIEPQLSKLMVKHLLAERKSMVSQLEGFKAVKDFMPALDWDIATSHERLVDFGGDKDGSEDGVDKPERSGKPACDMYGLRKAIASEWSYTEFRDEGLKPVRWFSAGGLRARSRDADFEDVDLYDMARATGLLFSEKITSQLLLYRIIIMFGLPKEDMADGYKSHWGVCLQWSHDDSRVQFYDYKGWASTQFHGTKEGSEAAMKLLHYLVSKELPHD